MFSFTVAVGEVAWDYTGIAGLHSDEVVRGLGDLFIGFIACVLRRGHTGNRTRPRKNCIPHFGVKDKRVSDEHHNH